MSNARIKVVLVDDHAAVRTGFRLLLESAGDIEVVAEMESGEEINQQINKIVPDVIVMDLSMHGMGGLEAIRRVRLKSAKVRILVFTMHDNVAFVEQSLEAGANGYITKNNVGNVLLQAIRKVHAGESYIEEKFMEQLSMRQNLGTGTVLGSLSRREFQIFCKFAEGLSVQEIADELSLSIKTVANYQTQIKEKLGISSTAELVKLAIANGVIQM